MVELKKRYARRYKIIYVNENCGVRYKAKSLKNIKELLMQVDERL